MTGLRERQKANRTGRILRSASDLFRAQGYDAIRIEDIAAAAEVSAGTCYNYFSTKGDLLLAIVSMEVEEAVDAGRALVAVVDMHDQGMVARPPLGAEHLGDGGVVGGIGAQAVHRFGRKRDQRTVAQGLRRTHDRLGQSTVQ